KITLLFLLLTLSLSINAQFTEGFESGIPDDWTVINNGGANGWVQNTSPSGGALEGSAVASITYNSSAHDDYLITPALAVSVGVNESLGFNVKSGSSTYLEEYEVLLSTTNPSEAEFSVVLQASSEAPNAWTKIIFDLSAYDGQTVYVAIRASSADELYLFVDDVYSGIEVNAPECAITPLPAIAETDVEINTATASVNIGWEAPASGSAPTGYEIFWGETSGSLTSIGTTAETSVSITNVNYNTTYYWMAVPTNAGGSAEGCAEWSFTTDPIANPDYLNPFTVYPGAGWAEATGPINEPTGTSSSFIQDDFGNDTTHANGKSARINIYGTGVDEYLVTTKFDLSGGTYYLNFDIALTLYGNSNASALDPDDYLALLVTQDDGASWTELARWDETSTLTPEGAATDELTLSGYNNDTYFAFYAFSDTSGVDNDLFIDNFQVTASSLTAPSAPTADAPTPPARQAGDVVSVYSDAYTNINVTNFNPGWGQTGAVDAAYDPTGAGTNTVLEYSNFNYQGTEFDATDASAMEFVHIDIWTADATDVKFSPINNGTGTTEVLVNVPLVTGEWSSVDIAIADFTGMTWDSLFQMKFDGGAGVNPSTIYIDNVYFYKEAVQPVTAPTTDAPTPPARETGDVISIYSDAYTNINVTNFNPGWGQTGAVDAAYDPTGAGTNTVLEYSNFNYQGTEFDATDASAMEFVHIDIWTANATDVKFSPINNGTGAGEFLVSVPVVTGEWSSVDIAIADFTGMTWDSLFQMKFDGAAGVNPSTIYIDNVYFYKEAVQPVTAPTTDAPTPPARETGDVISIYSDAYTNINVTNFNPGWGQTGAVDAAYDPTGAGTNTVLEYSNFNYQGTEFDATDASAMEFVHIDIWTANATDVKFSPINNGTGAGEFLVSVPVVTGEWSSVDIAIADFTGMTWDSLFQMKFDGQGGVNPSAIYIDNVYFYKEPSATSDVIFITELADPNDNAAARYVEIYNGGTSAVDLTGWTLRRYTNGNADPQTTGEDLSPIGSLAPGAIAIIAANGTAFEAAFGMAADISAGTGGPADSNGDDQIYITDASDTIVDFFGVAGEDGSGTDHEFEDGRAERKASVTQGTATWDVSEWNIDNDGGAGDGALNVDGGFDPGVWIGAETAGVEDESLVTLNMYPNPANDVLNISAQNTINTVEIYNVLGQKVISMQVENTSAEINVSNLNAGIYLIKYEINNSTSTKKFVKN
ncbi:choice-of-anchor J domain-containing protein, partial [Polaribacter sp.]|nr:choice-of-anchor J domain-containing protein [Polaribacter sp.]